ncbi:hypothetical protein JCM8547_005105 [Rhodosporidiobolus lusitaniae]
MASNDVRFATAPYVYITDHDGTVTDRDSNDTATDDLGFGPEKRRALNVQILNGEIGFRDAFRMMLDSISDNGHDFESVKAYLVKHIGLDPGFKGFLEWSKQHNLPIVIVSSGMKPIIEACLINLIGAEDTAKIEIIANDVEILEGGKWRIVFRHEDSPFGHDKSRSTAAYRALAHRPTLFFSGDGVSDLSAAKATDCLFVKVIPGHTNDLKVHCDREQIPHIPFEHFGEVKEVVERVIVGGNSIKAELAKGATK